MSNAAWALLLVYAAVRFVLDHWLDSLGEYASYLFECLFVAVTWAVLKPALSWKPRMRAIDPFAALAAGFAVSKGLGALELPCPFDLQSAPTLVFLLLIGPVLEEFLFRVALWEAFAGALRSISPLWPTSILFSFGHLFAWWSVPEEFKGFVLYQAAYTLALGYCCGRRRLESRSVLPAVAIHLSFNLGFYLGA